MKVRLIEVGWLTTLQRNREVITVEIDTLKLRFMQRRGNFTESLQAGGLVPRCLIPLDLLFLYPQHFR
jgi:hypothetical protein